ncbi:MAG: TcfC E-set like domain-containing protein [Gammaproteobacteria bacterium]
MKWLRIGRTPALAVVLLFALVNVLPDSSAQNSAGPDSQQNREKSEAKPRSSTPLLAPVFTLGPMPLLPPPSWTAEDEKNVSFSDATTTDKQSQRNTVSQPVNNSSNTSRSGTTNAEDTSVTVKPSDENRRNVVKTSRPDTKPKASSKSGTSATTFESASDKFYIVAPKTAESIKTPSIKSESPEISSSAEPLRREQPRPVMEQVDVTAKRLPAPAPFEVSESGFRVSSAPPPGFEDLASAQTTLVDVVYGKRVIASVMATFDMGIIEFINPVEILNAVPDVIDDVSVLNALTGPLDANAAALCYGEYDTECGRISPEIAAVIFDDTRFRAQLFIHPDYLATNYLTDSTYLPPSDSGTASVHLFSMSANGDEINQNFNMSASSLVSMGETRLEAQYDIDSSDGLSIDTFSLKHDSKGWEYEAGAFRSRIQTAAFLTEQNLVGARVATSLNTRTDLRYAEATPLFAYLEQRSRVDILRGSQLLDSQFYEAGNQQLDTSRLPDGAYNVTIRVAQDSGQNRDTEFYFARTSVLPPKDQPLYFAEVGQLALSRQDVLPELTSNYWLRMGTAHRIRDDFGLEAAVSTIGGATLIEGGLVWFQPGLQLQATLLGGDSTGVSLRTVWQNERLSLSADLRHITSSEAVMVDNIDLLPGEYTQANLSASLPLLNGRVLAQGRWDMRGARDFKSFGVNYSREVKRFNRSTLSLNVDTILSTDDNVVRFGLDWRWREQGRDATFRPRVQYSADTGRTNALINARYNKMLRNDPGGTYRASAFVDRAIDRSVIGARVSGETTRGVGEAELQYGLEGEQTGAAYIANARFGLVSSGKQFAFGGRRSNASSIIVEIDGNATTAEFEVLIGQQSHGYARSGSSTVVALPPYETYDVRLVSRGGEFVEFDEKSQSVTLYPGNVKKITFTASRQVVVVGQVVDEEGHTIAHHKFADLDGFASTDENGWFQIEVTDVKPLTLKRGEASICVIELPIESSADDLVVLDEVICR